MIYEAICDRCGSELTVTELGGSLHVIKIRVKPCLQCHKMHLIRSLDLLREAMIRSYAELSDFYSPDPHPEAAMTSKELGNANTDQQ